MPTRTRFVFLMHPKEFKHEKAGTGRLTHLCLADSEIHMGLNFDADEAVQELIANPANFPVLVYPGPTARNLTTGALAPAELRPSPRALPPRRHLGRRPQNAPAQPESPKTPAR